MQNTPNAQPAPKPAEPQKPRTVPPPEFQEGAIATMDAAALVAVLSDPKATEFQKAKACHRAAELADKSAVPALAALLASDHLSTYARCGLEIIADESAAEALRAALPKLKGDRLIGVINSIGKRRDPKAAPALIRFLRSSELPVACAAASALGRIGNEVAVKELRVALARTKEPLRAAVADGALLCAEALLADGKRDQSLAVYAWLSAATTPTQARVGAMAAIIRLNTALGR
jgi:HEAT repeat protein